MCVTAGIVYVNCSIDDYVYKCINSLSWRFFHVLSVVDSKIMCMNAFSN